MSESMVGTRLFNTTFCNSGSDNFTCVFSNNCNWNWKAVTKVTLLVTAAASAWLSDVDEGNSTQQRVNVVLLSDCGNDRPSVGSSPRQTDSSSPEQQQHKPEIVKVDYTRGPLILATEKWWYIYTQLKCKYVCFLLLCNLYWTAVNVSDSLVFYFRFSANLAFELGSLFRCLTVNDMDWSIFCRGVSLYIALKTNVALKGRYKNNSN